MKKFKKIYIEITNVCNLSCSFCSAVEKDKRFMTVEEFTHIIKEIKPYTNTIYLHVKGEPLLHPDLFKFLKIAENEHINVNIATNGTLFPKLASELGKYPALKKINFSLHSENNIKDYVENILEAVSSFPQTITIIYRLWTLKDGKLDEKSTKIVEKIKSYYNLSPETVEKIKNESNVKISSTIYVDKNNEFEWPEITSHKSCGYCHALKTHIAILVDGTVVPCCLDSNGIINLGNIYQESIKEIQKKERYQNLKESFQDRKPSEKLCQSCTFKLRNNP